MLLFLLHLNLWVVPGNVLKILLFCFHSKLYEFDNIIILLPFKNLWVWRWTQLLYYYFIGKYITTYHHDHQVTLESLKTSLLPPDNIRSRDHFFSNIIILLNHVGLWSIIHWQITYWLVNHYNYYYWSWNIIQYNIQSILRLINIWFFHGSGISTFWET